MGTDLKAFCAAEDAGRYALHEPWVCKGWRYATNGRIMVRAPAPDEPDTVAERMLPDPGPWFCDGGKYTHSRCTIPFPTHDGTMVKRSCQKDHGPECSSCNGTGECECSDCGNKHDCAACNGTGENRDYNPTSVCSCGGTGVQSEPAPMDVGGKLVAAKYVVLIAGLPNARYDPDRVSDIHLCFRADGGLEGVVAAVAMAPD